ncbi:hypothetical protein M422DRAFT_25532 [Sphaerobolus stellatus SS14]|nr:hypothetical protein M422DRAFT_25532 [Sphaerobolus stellatus SS14]
MSDYDVMEPYIHPAIPKQAFRSETGEWYTSHEAGGIVITFVKHCGEAIRDIPLNYLYWCFRTFSQDNQNNNFSPHQRHFLECASRYINGLLLNMDKYLSEFVVPYGGKYPGKSLKECDIGWMRWIIDQDHLVYKEPLFCIAITGYLCSAGILRKEEYYLAFEIEDRGS